MTIGAVLADYGMKNSIGSTYALLDLQPLFHRYLFVEDQT
ncbi:hypothetical protein L278_12590 [Mannheimia haemolytica D35]|nr:hypothetical protein L278_12590 [Mannheimia haemolytica D35]